MLVLTIVSVLFFIWALVTLVVEFKNILVYKLSGTAAIIFALLLFLVANNALTWTSPFKWWFIADMVLNLYYACMMLGVVKRKEGRYHGIW